MDISSERRAIQISALAIFSFGFLIQIWLIWTYPPLYGGDTVLHLRNHEHIFLGHQLPLLQALIFLTYKVTDIPMAVRCGMAVIGAAAGLGFYLLAKSLINPKAALCAALFFVTNPFVNEISIVPFQEILMLGTLCFATYFYLQNRIVAASLMLALACLARYEAWIACPFFAFDYVMRNRRTFAAMPASIFVFCWVPLAWIGWHLGLASPGSYVIEMPRSFERLVRWIYLCWILIKNTPLPVLLFGLSGLYFVWIRRGEKRVRTGAAFALLFGIAVLFSAHGDNHSGTASTERFVSSREAILPAGAVLLLAGVGAGYLHRKQKWRLPVNYLLGAAVLLGLFQSTHFVRFEVSQPDVSLSYQLARYVDAHLQSGERMLISAKPFSSADLDPYIEKVREVGGESAYKTALRNLATEDLSPIDFQRTAVQCRRAGALAATGNPDNFEWIAVWSDSQAKPTFTNQLSQLRSEDMLRAGSLAIAIYHRPTKK